MADYAEIIAAIDAAVLDWAGEPVRISDGHGRDTTYRSLDDLIKARKYYAGLANTARNKRSFVINTLKTGDAR